MRTPKEFFLSLLSREVRAAYRVRGVTEFKLAELIEICDLLDIKIEIGE